LQITHLAEDFNPEDIKNPQSSTLRNLHKAWTIVNHTYICFLSFDSMSCDEIVGTRRNWVRITWQLPVLLFLQLFHKFKGKVF
jgi:hypothetical protein